MLRIIQNSILVFFVFASALAIAQTEPSQQASAFAVNAVSDTEIELTWTDAAGATLPEFYLIVGRKLPSGVFATVADGPTVPADADWTNNNFAAIIPFGDPNTLTISGLDAATEYEFRIYAYREITGNSNYRTTGTPTASDFTFSAAPLAHSATFTATLSNDVDINLAFDASAANATGYLIYRNEGSAVDLTGLANGAAPPATLNGADLIETTDNADDAYPDNGLTGGLTYHYVLVPYTYNGSNSGTYNYLTDGSEPEASETTNLVVSLTQLTAGANLAGNPLNSNSTNNAILGFSITTNGPTTFDDLDISLSTSPTGKFTNPRMFLSGNTSFGGDVSINTGTLAGPGFQFSSIGQVLTAGTTHYFIVADVVSAVNGSTEAIEPSFTEADIAFTTPVATPAAFTFTGTDYTFADATPPQITDTNPDDDATGISVLLNTLQITFDEAVVYVGDNSDDNNRIRIRDLDAGGTPFVETIEVTDVSVAANVVTLTFNFPLVANTDYAVHIGNSVFEDAAGNDFAGIATNTAWNFQTESEPDINSISPAATCVGETVTIQGTGFGVAVPTIIINGVTITNILSNTATEVQFQLPNIAAGDYTIEITNNSNNLTGDSGSDEITIKPSIASSLPIASDPAVPSVDQNYDIDVANTQTFVSYAIRTLPGSFGSNVTGNGAVRSFGPYQHATAGTYAYEVRATSSGCTTVTYPFSVTIADIQADAGADQEICEGENVTLGGSPAASGGTGFHQVTWVASPADPSLAGKTNLPNPTVSPLVTTTYTLTVDDNSTATPDVDQVTVTVNEVPEANFAPSMKINFSTQDSVYLLSNKVTVDPVGGVSSFSGLGVTAHSNGSYYFDPKVVGTQTNMPIIFNYRQNNCSTYDTAFVNVTPANVIVGLESAYCSNESVSGTLSVNAAYLAPTSYIESFFIRVDVSYVFKRLTYYNCLTGLSSGTPPNPITQIGATNNYQLSITQLVNNNYAENCHYVFVIADQRVVRTDLLSSTVISDVTNPDLSINAQRFAISYTGLPPEITSIQENANICADASAIQLTTNIPGYTINSYTINDGTDNSIVQVGLDYFFDPEEISFSSETAKNFKIILDYNDDNRNPSGGCQSSVERNFTVVRKPVAPNVNNAEYCQFFQGDLIMTAESTIGSKDFNWYQNSDLSDTPFSGAVFVSGVNPDLVDSKEYYITQLYLGCESAIQSANLAIVANPAVTLNFDTPCENVTATFEGPDDASITSWEWDFGDQSGLITGQAPQHTYTTPNPYTIRLKIISDYGTQQCVSEGQTNIVVGATPKPNFTFNQICAGDATQFTAELGSQIINYEWDFNGTPFSSTNNQASHTFTSVSTPIDVTLTTTTNLGCKGDTVKQITILPFLTHNTEDPYRMTGNGNWQIETPEGSNSSWIFAPPDKTIIKSASEAWVTNATGNHLSNERSYVNSPCLNISAINKPVISLEYISNTDDNSDGAVLEYSKNGGVTWIALGSVNSGLNWFNTQGFSSTIGNSTTGWSGDIFEIVDNDTIFVEGRRAIDDISGLNNPSDRTKLRFRIAFGSTNEGEAEGFAFRNVAIESRDRTMLAENFTNQAAGNYAANNTAFATISETEVVKLQYHVGFPGNDAIYDQNTSDPSARSAFYGITNTLVPRGYIDGFSAGSFTQGWDNTYRSTRSLVTAKFNIDINTVPIDPAQPDVLQFAVEVNAKDDLLDPATERPTLYVAVIEQDVNGNSVVRKLLPNPVGKRLTLPITTGQTITESYQWRIDNTSIVTDEIGIVAFIQDERTKEVYQAYALLNPDPAHIPDADVITSTEDPEYAKHIDLYPNPANTEVHIELPAAVNKPTPVMMVDTYGRTVHEAMIKVGEKGKTIPTTTLADGMYLMQIMLPQGGTEVRKVMVKH